MTLIRLLNPWVRVPVRNFTVYTSLLNKSSRNGNQSSQSTPKSRLNMPPSFKSSRPLPKNILTDEERMKIQSSGSGNKVVEITPISYKSPWWIPLLKISVVFIPMLIVGVGYIIYETAQGNAVFFPLWFNSSVPLEDAIGFENVDMEMLKEISKQNLLRRLNLNHQVKEYFGLPVELGDFEDFNVRVEYNNLAVEGIELDFRKSWFNPIVKYKEIETPRLPPNINSFVQPLKMKMGNEGIESIPDDDSIFFDEKFNYKIKIRSTIPIVNEKINRIQPGTGKITFDAEFDLDHTKLLKITSAMMHFKNKEGSGSGGTLEKLW